MWTVIYMAQSKESVEKMRKLIEDNGILTKVRALKKSEQDYCFEILVPASEVFPAQDLILETEL